MGDVLRIFLGIALIIYLVIAYDWWKGRRSGEATGLFGGMGAMNVFKFSVRVLAWIFIFVVGAGAFNIWKTHREEMSPGYSPWPVHMRASQEFMAAVNQGDLQTFDKYLPELDVNAPLEGQPMLPLEYVVMLGTTDERNATMVKRLVDKGADPALVPDLLIKAIRRGNYAVVGPLLDAGADPNAGLPLHVLLKFSSNRKVSHDAVRALVMHGANPYAEDEKGKSALDLARGETKEIVQGMYALYLESRTVRDPNRRTDRGSTVLIDAIAGNDIAAVRELLSQGADANLPNAKGFLPLSIAVKNGNYPMVELLARNGADPYRKEPDGGTALHHVVSNRNAHTTDLLRLFLALPGDIELSDMQRRTPLGAAFAARNFDAARHLAAAGANLWTSSSAAGQPAEFLTEWPALSRFVPDLAAAMPAGEAGQRERLKLLDHTLSLPGGEMAARELFAYLLDTGLKLGTPIDMGAQPLPVSEHVRRMFMQRKFYTALGDLQNAMAGRAIGTAGLPDPAAAQETTVCQAIPPAPAALNRQLLEYARNGLTACALAVLKAGALPVSADANGWTALHHAASHSDVTLTRALLNTGADAKVLTRWDSSLLQVAGRRAMADYFAALRGAVAATTKEPMLLEEQFADAVARGNAVMELLLKAGADPDHHHSADPAPLVRAVRADDLEKIRLLDSYGADWQNGGGTYFGSAMSALSAFNSADTFVYLLTQSRGLGPDAPADNRRYLPGIMEAAVTRAMTEQNLPALRKILTAVGDAHVASEVANAGVHRLLGAIVAAEPYTRLTDAQAKAVAAAVAQSPWRQETLANLLAFQQGPPSYGGITEEQRKGFYLRVARESGHPELIVNVVSWEKPESLYDYLAWLQPRFSAAHIKVVAQHLGARADALGDAASALIRSVRENNAALARVLLAEGVASVQSADACGVPVIDIATHLGRTDLVTLLTEYGAVPSGAKPDASGACDGR